MSPLLLSMMALVTAAQPQAEAPTPDVEFTGLSARAVVREANRRLIEGDADEALGAYEHAQRMLPDAREIAFGEGLANYDLKKFDEARAAFEKVAVEGADALATDAQYGIGTCDHVEALENTDNPKMAISLLESAMRRYHRVLAENPHHQAALDANMKAASVWRRIKEMQEQQEQQQSDDGEKKEKQESDENQDQQQKGNDEKESDKEQQQEQESDSSEDQRQEQPQQQSAEQKEQQVSREQAQRQLREMMQALRERKKARPRKVIKMPIAPVDKDW